MVNNKGETHCRYCHGDMTWKNLHLTWTLHYKVKQLVSFISIFTFQKHFLVLMWWGWSTLVLYWSGNLSLLLLLGTEPQTAGLVSEHVNYMTYFSDISTAVTLSRSTHTNQPTGANLKRAPANILVSKNGRH